jgi:hypothetical protein
MKSKKVIVPPEIFLQLESIQKSLTLHQERAHELELNLPSLDLATAQEVVEAWKFEVRDDVLPQIRRVTNYLRQMALDNSRPPFDAEFMLHLSLGKEERAAVIGDLVEEYRLMLRRFGRRRANIWFYKQVAGSVWPLFQRAVSRVAKLAWLARILTLFG